MEDHIGLKKCTVLIILESEKGFLLIQRNKNPHKGKFIAIGGKIDPFEEPRKAAIREVYEETGIKIKHLELCGVLVETSPVKFNWVNFVYYSKTLPVDLPSCNEGILHWINIDNINKLPIPETDLYIYKFIKEKRKFFLNALYNDKIELINLVDEIMEETLYNKK